MSDHGHALARDFSFSATSDLRAFLTARDLERDHGGDVFGWARKLGVEAGEILDFSASVNPLGPLLSARRAFFKSFHELSCYPDSDAGEAREAIARQCRLEPRQVLLGSGSTQLIHLLCRALRPRKALVVHPAFSEYANGLKLVGAEIRSYLLSAQDDFTFSLERFTKALQENPDMIFLANPNSATGRAIPRAKIEEVARMAREKKTFLVVDEAFIDFVEADSVQDLIRDNPYLIVLNSPGKYYALPGLRLGYLLAARRVVDRLCLHREPWSVNTPAQRVLSACFNDANFKRKTRRWLEREREFLLGGLSRIRWLRPYESQANFLLVRLARGSASRLHALLLKRKMLIRVCDSFSGLGADYFRVAIRSREENRRLLEALEGILGGGSHSSGVLSL